jgi:hypothetical protein
MYGPLEPAFICVEVSYVEYLEASSIHKHTRAG